MDANDAQLLREYAQRQSPAAFEQLVRRHGGMVHGAALRQTRDRHRADDVTQAVFMILARRAGSISDAASLTGWLINTTRYAALSAMRLESRRRFHEQKASDMVRNHHEPSPAVDDSELASTLDEALAHLGAKDRSAIALRFLQGKRMQEVGDAMGISEQAAQKRIARALARLRGVLARRGVMAPADALAMSIAAIGAHPAPAELLPLVLGHHAAATAIAHGAMKTMAVAHLKFASSLAAGIVLAAGGATAIVVNSQSPAQAAAPPAQTTPAAVATATPAPVQTVAPATKPAGPSVTVANVTLVDNWNRGEFANGIDTEMRRTTEPAALLSSTTPKWGMSGASMRGVDITPFRGKRVRYTAWLKCNKLANWGGLVLHVGDMNGRIYAWDDMGGRPITGTTDWKQMETVADVPQEATLLRVGMCMHGSGDLWLDGAKVEAVGNDVPVQDDSIWHAWSFSSPHYSTSMDAMMMRNGHPTRLLQSTRAGAGEWYAWDHNDRHPEQYLGKRLKMTAWIKTENVTGPSGLSMRFVGPNFQNVIPDAAQRNIRGTNDWKMYEVTADVPPETQDLCSGFRLGGKGKMWVDEVKYEIVPAK